MKYHVIGLLLFLHCSHTLQAEPYFRVQPSFKAGAFAPNSNTFRTIFTKIIPCYQAEFDVLFNQNFSVWSNATYFVKQGKTPILKIKTKIRSANLSLGIKLFSSYKKKLYFSLALGPNYSWLKESNEIVSIADTHIERLGMIAKFEIVKKMNGYYLGLFGDYLHKKVEMGLNNIVDLSGVFFGVIISMRF